MSKFINKNQRFEYNTEETYKMSKEIKGEIILEWTWVTSKQVGLLRCYLTINHAWWCIWIQGWHFGMEKAQAHSTIHSTFCHFLPFDNISIRSHFRWIWIFNIMSCDLNIVCIWTFTPHNSRFWDITLQSYWCKCVVYINVLLR